MRRGCATPGRMNTAQPTPTPATKEGSGHVPTLSADALLALITDASNAAGLPVRLVAAMVKVESGGNPRATRFEPAFLERYIRPLKLDPEESKGRATSWGLMQIMGQTAWTCGFRGSFEELLDPATGLKWGCEYLHRLCCRYPREPWEVICRAYNGGPGNRHNAANVYPAKVLRAAAGVWPSREG